MDLPPFEIYLLAQSWAASFCCVKPERCGTMPVDWSSTHLCLHGLWPAYVNKKEKAGLYPTDCKTVHTKFEQTVIPPLAVDLAPNYQEGLGKHEWKKHGTCSGLPPKIYFQEGLRIMLSLPRTDRGTPQLLMKNIGGSVKSEELRKCYDYKVGIKVTDRCVLEEITTCFAKENKGGHEKVGRQVDCPDYIMKGMRNNCDNKKCKGLIKINQINSCNL